MEQIKIASESIILRDWELKDLAAYRFWQVGEKHLWKQYDGPYYAKMTQKELDINIEKRQKIIKSKTWQTTRTSLVIADKSTDKFLGTVSWYWESKETFWKSIGLVIYDDKKWGKGLGFEALYLWVDYLFEADKQIVRLDLRTWGGHFGMIKLAEKLGFREEARFRKARIVANEYHDSIGMGILREEWDVIKMSF